jgi:hypothetical protein
MLIISDNFHPDIKWTLCHTEKRDRISPQRVKK